MTSRVPLEAIFSVEVLKIPVRLLVVMIGITEPTLYNWRRFGIPTVKLRRRVEDLKIGGLLIPQFDWGMAIHREYYDPGQMVQNPEREAHIVTQFRSGKTLQEIGEEMSLSRERIRQILKRNGVGRLEGGKNIQMLLNAAYKKRRDPAKTWMTVYGCSLEIARQINGGLNLSTHKSPAFRYNEQRRNAKVRGIGWEINLPEWWRVWQESGKWELRGPGKGYCMTRIGDTGPYRVGNVEIKTIGENFSESYYKHPWDERFGRTKTHCKRGHLRSENRTKSGDCHACIKIRTLELRANRKSEAVDQAMEERK